MERKGGKEGREGSMDDRFKERVRDGGKVSKCRGKVSECGGMVREGRETGSGADKREDEEKMPLS